MSTITAAESAQLHEAAKSLYEAMQRTDKALEEMESFTEPTPEQYHPVKAALSAAAAELTSPEAQRYYINRVQQDVQTAIVFIIQFGCFAYALGAQCRKWANEMEQSAQVISSTLKALPCASLDEVTSIISSTHYLPAFAPVALLSAGASKPHRLPARWVGETVLITPAPVATKPKRNRTKSPTQLIEPPTKGKRGRKPKTLTRA
jgi:hypothetical protein